MKALRDLHNAHAALMIHTVDGQLVFDTATSRLLNNRPLELKKGETATVAFTLDMNLRSGVFLMGFNISSEIDVPGQYIYYNGCVKRVVMSREQKANGIVHLNPRAELTLG